MTTAAVDFDWAEGVLAGWRRSPVPTEYVDRAVATVPTVVRTPLHRIFGAAGALRALRPLEVVVERGDDLWLAESEVVHVYASGVTPDEAIRDFSEQLIHFYGVYTSAREDELTGLASELKRVYTENFTPLSQP